MTAESVGWEEEVLGKGYDARLMARLLGYLRPYRWWAALAVLLLALVSVLEVVGPWVTRIALDEAIPRGDRTQLGLLAGVFLGAILLGFVLQYAQRILTTWLGQRIMFDLRREIFGKFQSLDIAFFDRTPVGRLITRITNDVETLNELFSAGIITVFGDVFTLTFIVAAMLRMDWRLALIAFSVLPFVAFAAFLFRAKVRSAYRDIRQRLARLNAFLHERITGMQVLQLFNLERREADRHRALAQDYLDAHLRSISYYALFFPIIELFTAIAFALVLRAGAASILSGLTTIGVVVAFLQYARRFFQPIQDLSEKYNLLQGAMASSERIFELLDRKAEVTDPPHPRRLPTPTRGEVEFRDVWFAYKSEDGGEPEWVLRGLSFSVAAGEKVAIVGHTGAGKTTLLHLLFRFYDPQRGAILLDGVPIDQVALSNLRSRLGLVLQDVFLFSRDVAYNLGLRREHPDPEALRQAAEEVGAHEFIERLPRGYGQPLAERGASLSVGERQLLSFARVLAHDPAILVLDEATSSVDSRIEARIEEATARLMEGRTAIVVAHRLSTVRGADRILVLHQGRIQEEGTHEELLERRGLYARLHELQFARAFPG